MSDRELRDTIREVLARRLRQPSPLPAAQTPSAAGPEGWRGHASHDIYVTVVNAGESCVIEPGVACNHCNYCKSHGH